MKNHKQKLQEIYKLSFTIDDIKGIDSEIVSHIETIGEKLSTQKGVFTVLVTLVTHKIVNPKQDIRYHQSSMENGFSGRTIDTKYITPTLKELGLPSMAESGWLTRSLEQPYPYTLDYNGKISNRKVKAAFLTILDFVERKPKQSKSILRLLLFQAIQVEKRLEVPITPLKNPKKITIQETINALNLHFNKKYNVHGGSKLPVLAFFAIYQLLIEEVKRYEQCSLLGLGSHTASDRTSKSSGDIEIIKSNKHYESIEIKLDKPIDSNMVRIAIEKIHRFNLERYYILSHFGIKQEDKVKIERLIGETKYNHGCQIILNGILPTIKYYLRLVDNTEDFLLKYSKLIEEDKELKRIHKTEWNQIIENNFKIKKKVV
jgi:DNA (cytosine-5)-methyltransferase 1